MNDLIRECTICGKDKFLSSDYYKGNHQCKKCKNAKTKAQQKKKQETAIKNNDTRTCKICEEEKSITEFKMTSLKCKECSNKKQYDGRKENVLDSAANNMLSRTPKDTKPKEYYINILTELLKKQENKCFYSGELLTVKQGCYNTISPERLKESIRGYNDINNLGAVCQLFQSSSIPVNVEVSNTIITDKMKTQIIERPYTIQRVSNKQGQNLEPGTVYKKVINFNINFDNEDEVNEEMKYLPNKMHYAKTKERFIVTNKEGNEKYFGKKKITLQGRFELAMEYWKGVYQNDYEIDDDEKYIEYFVYHNNTLNIIKICPETNYMTTKIEQFKKHKIYIDFPDCSPGKAQWSKEKFDLVKELSTREDSQERKDRIDKMINEARDIVDQYRNNNVKIETHTELTLFAHNFALAKSNQTPSWKSGEYKDLFLTFYDKVCKYRFRCEYTNIPMSLSACKNWHMSYERYNNKENYCGTNIAFVCEEFNTNIHWIPEHFKTFWDIDVPIYIKEKLNPSFNLSRRHRFY